jgi:Uma2 family endonuclease
MIESDSNSNTTKLDYPEDLLNPWEIRAHFRVLGPYLDEIMTPVPKFAFVRLGWIIEANAMSIKHNQMVFQITALIQKFLLAQGIQNAHEHVFSDTRVNLSDDPTAQGRNEKRPDIQVFTQPIIGDLGTVPQELVPVLIIEVMLDATELQDLTDKKILYREKGVKYYWALLKADTPAKGLESSFCYILRGGKYYDQIASFQETGILMTPDCFNLHLKAEEIWYNDPSLNITNKWHAVEQQAEQEKHRADQEKHRAEKLQKELDELKRKKN